VRIVEAGSTCTNILKRDFDKMNHKVNNLDSFIQMVDKTTGQLME
jgi:hypothetical protein